MALIEPDQSPARDKPAAAAAGFIKFHQANPELIERFRVCSGKGTF
jgi:hypothetical protein